MKKLIAVFLCFSYILCLFSCKKASGADISTDNIFDYVNISETYGDVSVTENVSGTNSGKYYLTCTATLRVSPKGDYSFTDAFLVVGINGGGEWTAIQPGGKELNGVDLLYEWNGKIALDKDGYGETTVFMYCYSNTYDKMHPSRFVWYYSVASADGTVTENK